MAQGPVFEGWVGLDKNSVKGNLVWQKFEPKTFEETDVDVSSWDRRCCGTFT